MIAAHDALTRKRRRQWNVLRRHLRPIVRRRYRNRCAACGWDWRLTVDHIVPVSRGGTNDLDNLQLLCEKCNIDVGGRGVRFDPWPIGTPPVGERWNAQ